MDIPWHPQGAAHLSNLTETKFAKRPDRADAALLGDAAGHDGPELVHAFDDDRYS
jgi:hypothetical protein